MDNSLIFKTEKEFEEYLKTYEVSQELSFKEFEEIVNLTLQHIGANFGVKFSIHDAGLTEEERDILKDKLEKLTEKDRIILYYLSLFVLGKNSKTIIDQLERNKHI